jgi:transcriptional regulator with GAF, ATPase, and Fis domain
MPEARLGKAFVNLADALVNGSEALGFLYLLCDRCREVLIADAAGVMISGGDGSLRLSAASSEHTHVLDLFEVQAREGPCYDAFETGRPIIEQDLEDAIERWPVFAPKALDAGIRAVYAFPLHLRDTRVGALNAFRHHSGSFEERDLHAGQALADVATIGIVQQRVIREAHQRSEQLQVALDSRVLIEQAKGVLAERRAVDIGTAFEMLRRHARNHSLSIREVCRAVIEGEIDLQ